MEAEHRCWKIFDSIIIGIAKVLLIGFIIQIIVRALGPQCEIDVSAILMALMILVSCGGCLIWIKPGHFAVLQKWITHLIDKNKASLGQGWHLISPWYQTTEVMWTQTTQAQSKANDTNTTTVRHTCGIPLKGALDIPPMIQQRGEDGAMISLNLIIEWTILDGILAVSEPIDSDLMRAITLATEECVADAVQRTPVSSSICDNPYGKRLMREIEQLLKPHGDRYGVRLNPRMQSIRIHAANSQIANQMSMMADGMEAKDIARHSVPWARATAAAVGPGY